MKNAKNKRKVIDVWGALLFFLLIAFVSQSSVLAFAYIQTKTSNNALIALLVLILIVILSAVCVVIDAIRRKITVIEPTNKILEATEQISKGDFSVRLEINPNLKKFGDYDLIMQNLNLMTAELEKMEVLKTDFISNVSHEIKTPLSIIQNYVTLLQDANLDEESRKKYVKTVMLATKRLTNLITNILKLNKLENQQLKVDRCNFNLTKSLSQCVLEFEDLIERKNIELSCELQDMQIYSSESLLNIVWNNLLSNAIKFTPKGGKVEITLQKVDYNAIIAIKDSGCGISKEVGKRIFEKFYQGDTSHSQEGNGLGLALVKKVIDILGGEISISSEIGKGSTFTVTLKNVIINK